MIGRRSTASLAFGLILMAQAVAWAQGAGAPQVEVQVERNRVAVGEPFWVRVTVTTGQGGATVLLPPGSPFELVARGGTSSSFQMSSSFSGGMQIIRQESFRWQLRCLRQGRQTLGPLVVNAEGRQYRAGTATIEVVAGAPGSPTPGPGGGSPPSPFGGGSMPFPPLPLPGQPAPAQPAPAQPAPASPGQLPGQIEPDELTGAAFDSELFVRTVLEPEEAWVGQQVVATVYLYTTLQLANVNVTREMSTDGFWSEDLLGPSRRLRFEDQYVGQQHFRVAVLRKSAIFPLREGTLTVGAPQLEATTAFRSLFSRRGGTIARAGVPVQLRVKALPTKGRPAGFHNGNVGVYDLTARVDRRRTKVGEPVTLTLEVEGRGHLRNVKLPPLGELEGARVYEPRVSDAVGARGENLGGSRRWEYLIMPQKAGTLEIPPVTFHYFDPEASEYRSKSSKAISIEVIGEGSEAASSSGSGDGEPRTAPSKAHEIGPLHTIRRESSLARSSAPAYGRWWFFSLLLLAPAAFFVLVVIQRVQRHRLSTADLVRARRAARTAKAILDEAARDGDTDRLASVTKAVNVFFQDRFGKSATGQTMDELRAFLSDRGASDELASRAVDLMERCERGRFGGEASGGDLVEEARALITDLDGLEGARGGEEGR